MNNSDKTNEEPMPPEAGGPRPRPAKVTHRLVAKAPIGRPREARPNDKCKCGSGLKSKKCCLHKRMSDRAAQMALMQDYYNATGKLELPLPVAPEAVGPRPEARDVEPAT